MRLADYGSLVCVAHDWQAAYDSRQALLADKNPSRCTSYQILLKGILWNLKSVSMKIEVLVNIKMCLVAFIIAIAMMLQSNISHISTSTISFSLSDSPTQRYSFPFSMQINYIFWNLECCTFVLICVHKILLYIYISF